MNANSLIVNTLKPIIPNSAPAIPNVAQLNYTGSESIYATFICDDDRGLDYADDTPIDDVGSYQIHLFTPSTYNYMSLKKQIRQALFEAGFTYPTVQEFYENDTKKNHIVFQCEIDGQPETED